VNVGFFASGGVSVLQNNLFAGAAQSAHLFVQGALPGATVDHNGYEAIAFPVSYLHSRWLIAVVNFVAQAWSTSAITGWSTSLHTGGHLQVQSDTGMVSLRFRRHVLLRLHRC
jgi:hypothetical protein